MRGPWAGEFACISLKIRNERVWGSIQATCARALKVHVHDAMIERNCLSTSVMNARRSCWGCSLTLRWWRITLVRNVSTNESSCLIEEELSAEMPWNHWRYIYCVWYCSLWLPLVLPRRASLASGEEGHFAASSTDEARDDNDLFLEDFEAIVSATMGTFNALELEILLVFQPKRLGKLWLISEEDAHYWIDHAAGEVSIQHDFVKRVSNKMIMHYTTNDLLMLSSTLMRCWAWNGSNGMKVNVPDTLVCDPWATQTCKECADFYTRWELLYEC